MGLFDNLKKAAIGKIVDTVEKAVENAATRPGTGHESLSRSSSAPQSSRDTALHNNSAGANTGHTNTDHANIDQKFDQILADEFSGLEIVRNASPESVGVSAPHPCKPYNYALLRNGKIEAVIMLTPHNRDRNSAFLNAKKSALDSNVKFLNFYTHFPNERNYVISRIKNAL